MGRFSGLGGVKTNQGGLYFLEGDYVVSIEEVKMIVNRNKQDTFIVSATVLESSCPSRAPGCRPSQVIVLKDGANLATLWGNIKQFSGALLGITDPDSYVPEDGTSVEDFWDQAMEFAVSEDQPMQGHKMRLTCSMILTKANKPFTKHVWAPYTEADAA